MIYLNVFMSICLFHCLSVCQLGILLVSCSRSIKRSVCWLWGLSDWPSVGLLDRLLICWLSVVLSIWQSDGVMVLRPLDLSVSWFVGLSICQSISLSVCLMICQSFGLSVWKFASLLVRLSVSFCLFLCLANSIGLNVCLSACPCHRLSVDQ